MCRQVSLVRNPLVSLLVNPVQRLLPSPQVCLLVNLLDSRHFRLQRQLDSLLDSLLCRHRPSLLQRQADNPAANLVLHPLVNLPEIRLPSLRLGLLWRPQASLPACLQVFRLVNRLGSLLSTQPDRQRHPRPSPHFHPVLLLMQVSHYLFILAVTFFFCALFFFCN